MVKLTEENFDDTLKIGTTVVKFGATWCGPCKMMDRILVNVDKKYENDSDVTICYVDVDESPKIAATFNITSVPTIIFGRNAKMLDRFEGIKSEKDIVDMIESTKAIL